MKNKRYVLSGTQGPWLEYIYECDSLAEAKRFAASKLQPGEKATVWDLETNQLIVEYELPLD